MKLIFIFLLSTCFVGCSSSGTKVTKTQVSKDIKDDLSIENDAAHTAVIPGVIASAKPSLAKASKPKRCGVKVSKAIVDFGSSKVTSRAFRRLKLKSSAQFTVTGVTSLDRPFGYYNSGVFPGEATYNDYKLCDKSTAAKECSLNLEFRPRAVNSYKANININYRDNLDTSCSLSISLKGIATESYLGKDDSRN